jgi:ATP-dependent DNA ligase
MEPIRKNNYFQFPTIYTATKTGKRTVCNIFCGVVKFNADKNVFKKLTSPDEISNIASRLKLEYDDNSFITDNVKGFIVMQNGYENGKITFRDATFITIGKNTNKSNQTNVWTQALSQAKSKYADKNRPNEASDTFCPMLANGSAVSKDLLDTTLYELHEKYENNYAVQYKYDGHRVVCRLQDQYCYSRTREQIYISNQLYRELNTVNEHINTALAKYAGRYNIYLDGEYYAHGMSLQGISSAVRSEEQSEEKNRLVYYVFDVPLTNKDSSIANVVCKDRLLALSALKKYFASYNFTNIIFVQTKLTKTANELKGLYLKAIKEQYEGLVLKVLDEIYEPGHNNYHSSNMIKVKQLLREEFLITGYKTGKGKAEGTIIFVCAVTEDNVNQAIQYMSQKGRIYSICPNAARGSEFAVKPKMTEEESKELYSKVVAEEIEIVGHLYTVEFRDWSDKFIPTQAVGIEML